MLAAVHYVPGWSGMNGDPLHIGADLLLAFGFILLSWRLLRGRLFQSRRFWPVGEAFLIANFNHEIRTPLGGITGYTRQLLHDTNLSESQREAVLAINRCAHQLQLAYSDLFEIARIQRGRAKYRIKASSFIGLLQDTIDYVNPYLKERCSQLDVVFQNQVPAEIYTEPMRLRQILTQLLTANLRQASGGVLRLLIRAEGFTNQEQEEGVLVFTLFDTRAEKVQGRRGIVDFLPRWNILSKIDTFHFRHTGLGLVLAKSLAQQLGGDLRLIESKPDSSNIICCTIKARRVAGSDLVSEFPTAARKQESPADAKAFIGKLRGVTLLLVEDGYDNQRIFTYFLGLAGAKVILEADSREVLRRLASESAVDMILMDIQLPYIDGYTLTRQLREQGFHKPIIAVTAHSLADRWLEKQDGLFDDYIAKPVDVEHFIETLRQHVRHEAQTPVNEEGHSQLPKENLASTDGSQVRSKYHDRPTYRPMIVAFAEGLKERTLLLEYHVKQGHKVDVDRLLHQMKGAAATYGYLQLHEKLMRMEHVTRAASDDWSQQFMPLLDDLNQHCAAIQAGLDT